MYVKKSDLKCIIKEILKEVTQKDILSRHPQGRSVWNDKWEPILKRMTLDNLKSLREKSKRAIEHLKGSRSEEDVIWRGHELTRFKIYDDEIKKRLEYINMPVMEDHGLGYSHNVSFDDPTTMERDPLNDPILTGKMNEAKYTFKDFPWAGISSGFEAPTDVYYGSIYLGTIVSKPDGYVIDLIDTPHGKKTVEYRNKSGQKRNPTSFKTKDIAAKVLHVHWKKQRST